MVGWVRGLKAALRETFQFPQIGNFLPINSRKIGIFNLQSSEINRLSVPPPLRTGESKTINYYFHDQCTLAKYYLNMVPKTNSPGLREFIRGCSSSRTTVNQSIRDSASNKSTELCDIRNEISLINSCYGRFSPVLGVLQRKKPFSP